MKIYIDNDELYPYYEASKNPEYPNQIGYEVSDVEWDEYQTMLLLFNKWQSRLKELSRSNPE